MSTWGYWAEDNTEVDDFAMEVAYDDWLDEVYGEVEVAGMTDSTSTVLSKLDPIRYRVGMSDFHNFMVEDGVIIEELESDED